MLRIKSRAWCLPGKHFTTDLHPWFHALLLKTEEVSPVWVICASHFLGRSSGLVRPYYEFELGFLLPFKKKFILSLFDSEGDTCSRMWYELGVQFSVGLLAGTQIPTASLWLEVSSGHLGRKASEQGRTKRL